MDSNIRDYLASWSSELSAKANRVRDLIGDAHWLSDGQHKEEILKAHLQRYLPSTYSITRGFIVDPLHGVGASGEIDILISDSSRVPSLLVEGDLTICLPTSVIGLIEVKTGFDGSTLSKALSSCSNNLRLAGQERNDDSIWSCIFFYRLDVTNELVSIIELVAKYIDTPEFRRKCEYTSVVSWQPVPKVIVVVDVCVIFISQNTQEISIKAFPSEELSAAVGIFDLLARISESDGKQEFWEFSKIQRYLNVGEPEIRRINLDGNKS